LARAPHMAIRGRGPGPVGVSRNPKACGPGGPRQPWLSGSPLTRCACPLEPALIGLPADRQGASRERPPASRQNQEATMYDSFTQQLAGLDFSGLTIAPAPFTPSDFPCDQAVEQTLSGVWSDLFDLFADTALEAEAENIAWGFVNLFHRAASRKSAELDRASDEIRALLASADGSEVHSSNLEEQVERAQAAEASMTC